MNSSVPLKSFGLALLLTAALGLGAVAYAASTSRVAFVTHAAFFSHETHQKKAIDPQVFVNDPSAAAATGPQNIQHVKGVGPALIDSDSKDTPLFNADHKALGFKLGQWLSAKGTVSITPHSDGKATVVASFTNLRPGGHYSLFENHFDQKPIGFTPLDGSGLHNNFTATKSGTARITVVCPNIPTHVNAILLVYHSDGKFYGKERGKIGITAHHQLIAPISK
jgi:hypothetical protein